MTDQELIIDADKAKFFVADVLDIFDVPICDKMAESLMRTIDALPTVDAVEVVRCKDCKYCDLRAFPDGEQYAICQRYGTPRLLSDYCSYGERRCE